MRPSGVLILAVLVAAPALVPGTAVAQSPTAAPHPSMPWVGITTPQGQLLRYIQMPPQNVTLEYLVAAPSAAAEPTPPAVAEPTPAPESAGEAKPEASAPSASDEAKPPAATGEEAKAPAEPKSEEPAPRESPPPPQIVHQVVTIPGYVVRETTVGYHYPERWVIEQVGPNAYRWRQLPAQFVPK
jgi:hypothetical protein